MKRKKRMKRLVVLFTGLTMGLMFSINVAANSKPAILDGEEIKAESFVTERTGTGATISVGNSTNVTSMVCGTYTYVHPITVELNGSHTMSDQKVPTASIYFVAPTNYRSLSIQCHHAVSVLGQQWSCDTWDSYYP